MTRTKKITTFGNPVLRTKSTCVEHFDTQLIEEIKLLKATLAAQNSGAALAAPQIGINRQIVVINYLNHYFELVNPVITYENGEALDYEGCLSLPDHCGRVKRAFRLEVNYCDKNGKGHTVCLIDRMARCFQHEIDHLHGLLYVDRLVEPYLLRISDEKKIPVEDVLKITGPAPPA